MLRVAGAAAVRDAVLVVVSELVTNAVRHGTGTVSIELEWPAHVVRVAVTDHGAGSVVRRSADLVAGEGQGLGIVEQMATAWGVEVSRGGKTVWAYVATAPTV